MYDLSRHCMRKIHSTTTTTATSCIAHVTYSLPELRLLIFRPLVYYSEAIKATKKKEKERLSRQLYTKVGTTRMNKALSVYELDFVHIQDTLKARSTRLSVYACSWCVHEKGCYYFNQGGCFWSQMFFYIYLSVCLLVVYNKK